MSELFSFSIHRLYKLLVYTYIDRNNMLGIYYPYTNIPFNVLPYVCLWGYKTLL